jgi:acetoin utilization protein AcuB
MRGGRIMNIRYTGFIRERIQKHPVTISPDASFYEARAIIREKGVRHLPVVDKNSHVVGIVTDSDIRAAAPSGATTLSVHELTYLLGKLKVSGFMTPKKKLITINPDTLVEEAVQLMHDNKIGCLPVLEGKKLYGIFTETDALELVVNIFGNKLKGTRLTIAFDDKPGILLGMLEILNKYQVNIVSLLLVSFLVDGKRLAVLRVFTDKYKMIVKELDQSGYQVLSEGKWPKP